jgi:hypothetical protein
VFEIPDYGAAQEEVGVRRDIGVAHLADLEPFVDAEAMLARPLDYGSITEVLGAKAGREKATRFE